VPPLRSAFTCDTVRRRPKDLEPRPRHTLGFEDDAIERGADDSAGRA